MNARVAVHMFSAAAAAVAGGVVSFAGLSGVLTQDVGALCALIVIVCETYLASTSTGVTANQYRISEDED